MDVCDQTPRDVRLADEEDHTVACHLYYDHYETEGAEPQPEEAE
jgi:peptide/nickel transport system ATP-binding protein